MDGDLLLGLLALAVISFLDDLYEVKPQWRLAVQIAVVVVGISAIDGDIFQGLLPLWLDVLLTAILWVWFINLYNFIDGIDGITSANTISLCVALVALYYSADNLSTGIYIEAAIIGAATLAFAPFNWHPAKVFMGDAGSIPLGFLMGYLLLQAAADGYFLAALILPAFHVTDATVTLIRRMLRGEKIWNAHSEHYYQRAVRAGMAHDEVVRYVVALNCILAVLAVLSVEFSLLTGAACLIAAYAATFLLMHYLARRGKKPLKFLRNAPSGS